MKRAIYLAVISIITVMCVVFGSFSRYSKDAYNTGNWFKFGDNGRQKESLSYEVVLDAFDAITVKADVMELAIEEGDCYGISYKCTESLIPTWSVKNGELKLTQSKKKYIPWIRNNCRVIITVPQKSEFGKINIASDVGDINISDIKADYLSVNIDVGDITIRNCITDKNEISNDTGNIDVKSCVFKSLDAETDVGDVVVESDYELLNYAFNLRTDVGDVTINGEDFNRKYKVNGSSGDITVMSDVGDIKISYTDKRVIDIENMDIGDIDIGDIDVGDISIGE